MADQFGSGKGYLPMTTPDLGTVDFTVLQPEEYDLGRLKKRHGGILSITDEEYSRLAAHFGK